MANEQGAGGAESTRTGHAELGISVNGRQAVSDMQEIGRAGRKMGQDLRQAGQDASKGFTDMGEAAQQQSGKVGKANAETQRAISQLQRQIAEYRSAIDGVSRAEALAPFRNIDTANAQFQQLAQMLREVRTEAAQASSVKGFTDGLERQIDQAQRKLLQLNHALQDAGRDLIGLDSAKALEATALAAGDAAAQMQRLAAAQAGATGAADDQIEKLRQLIAAQAAAQGELDQQKKIDQLTDRVTRLYEGLGKTAAGMLEAEAKALGLTDQLGPMIERLKQAETGFQGVGREQRLAMQQAALVYPQLTDIITQLEMGANPLTILIQQGGQLIDIFGGLQEAWDGLTSVIVDATKKWAPVIAIVGTIAAVGFAMHEGAKEADAFTQAVVMNGHAAGVTVAQLQGMAEAMANVRGTEGAAAAALTEFARSGEIGAESIQRFATVAQQAEKVIGQAIGDTVKVFEELGNEPLKATLKLNESLGHLTATVYEEIKALEEQGRKAEAAAVAQNHYADVVETRLTLLADRAGILERAWGALGSAAKWAWDRMMDVGREPVVGNDEASLRRLKALQSQLERVENDPNQGAKSSKAEQLRLEIANLSAKAASTEAEQQGAIAAAETNEQLKLRQELDREFGRVSKENLSAAERERRLNAEITAIRERGAKAKWDEWKIEELIAAKKKEYERSAGGKGSQAPFNDRNRAEVEEIRERERIKLEIIKRSMDDVQAQRAMGQLSERAMIEETLRLDLRALETRRQSLLEQADVVGAKKNSLGEARKLERQAAELEEQMATRQQKAKNELKVVNERLIQQTKDLIILQAQEAWEEETRAIRDAAVARTEYHAAQLEQAEALEEEQKMLTLQATLLGASDSARRIAIETLRIQLRLERELEEIRLKQGNDADLIDQARANAAKEISLVQQQEVLQTWQRTAQQIESVLLDAILEGGEKGKEGLERLFKQLVLRPIISAIVQPISGTLGALFAGATGGGGAGGGGGGSGLGGVLNGASTASSIYNAYTGASIASLGGTISGIGSFLGSSSMAAYGAGMGMTAAEAAAAAAAYQSAAAAGGASAATYAATGSAISAGASTGSVLSSIGSAIPYVAVVLAVLNAFGVFRSNKPVGGGLVGTVGSNGDLDSYTLMRRGGTLFSGPSYSIRTQDADAGLVKGIQDAVFGMLNQARTQAGIVGQAGNLNSFTAPLGSDLIHPEVGKYGIKLDGLSQEDAAKKVQEEIAKLAEKMASQALGQVGLGMAKYGESAADALSRLSTSLSAVNGALKTFGDNLLSSDLAGADFASKLIDQFGGMDAFNQLSQAYYQAYYSETERLATATKELQEAFGKLGVNTLPQSREQLRKLIEAQDLTKDSGRALYAGLMQLAPAFDAIQTASEEQRREAEQRQSAVLQERLGIEQQILQLEGNKTELRRRELEQLDPSNRALQYRLYYLQDQAELQQQAMARDAQRATLQTQLLQLQGNTEELRRREIAALDPWNQGMLRLIHQLQDQQAAAEKAKAVLEERKGLEQQLLDLQGNTAELRRRELELLDPSNRALKEQIFALQDAAEAARKAQELRDVWKGVGDTIADEIKRIRGLAFGESPDGGFAFLQAQFATMTAQARAGDQEAAKQLPDISRALLEAAEGAAGTAADLGRIQAATAASLEQTMRMLQHLGVEVPGFADGGAFAGGLRLVGERGPELEVTGPARIFSAEQTRQLLGSGNAAELRALREELRQLREDMRIGHARLVDNTGRAARVLENVSQDGETLTIKEQV